MNITLKPVFLRFAGLLDALARLTGSEKRQPDLASDTTFPREEAAGRLAGAVRFRTVSHRDPGLFEQGEFTGLHSYLEEAFPLVHRQLERETVAGYSLLYTWKGIAGRERPFLLMAHMDVVPAAPETDWTYPPFEGRIADGYIWGRGTLDDKQSLMGILEAVESLLNEGFTPDRTVYLAFGHDEETGGIRGSAQIVEHLRSRGVELDYVLDEGLVITQGVVQYLSRPVALVGIAEKGYLSIELSVETTGGHASMPPQRSAIGILGAAIHKLEHGQFPMRLEKPIRQMFSGLVPGMPLALRFVFSHVRLFEAFILKRLASSPSTNAAIRTTTAVTVFQAGDRENVLPNKARAVVNFRILPGDSIESVFKHVSRVVDDSRIRISSIDAFMSEPSPVSDTGSRAYRVIERTVREIFPEALTAPGLTLAASDSRMYTGLARNTFRFGPVVYGPEDVSRVHGTDERISLEGYERSVRFYAALIVNSCAG